MHPLSSSASAPAAPAMHRLRLWWRRLGRRGAAGAAAFAFALLAAAFFLTPSRDASGPSTASYPSYGHRLPTLVDLTLVAGAKERGAVCLDGTPPGYHWLPGFGEGSDKWLLHLEGGSWCRNLTWCAQRKETNLGSSDHMERRAEFVGILSDDELQNPDFYNWNKVKVRYCDGASFSGNVEEEFQDGTPFFFRGQRIWEAVMSELLSKGLSRAKEAFLTGCSAGGLSTYIHCDDFVGILSGGGCCTMDPRRPQRAGSTPLSSLLSVWWWWCCCFGGRRRRRPCSISDGLQDLDIYSPRSNMFCLGPTTATAMARRRLRRRAGRTRRSTLPHKTTKMSRRTVGGSSAARRFLRRAPLPGDRGLDYDLLSGTLRGRGQG